MLVVVSGLLIGVTSPVGVGARQAQPDPRLIRVFLTTDDGGHPDELRARRDSVRHLSDALAKQKKLLVLVDKEEQGDVSVEVLERRVTVPRVVIGIGARPGQPPGGGGPARSVQLVVRLESHDDGVRVMNKNEPLESSRGWASAADDIAKQIEQWITKHRQRILDAR